MTCACSCGGSSSGVTWPNSRSCLSARPRRSASCSTPGSGRAEPAVGADGGRIPAFRATTSSKRLPLLNLASGPKAIMHLVLFDIDGTLTLTEEVDNRCYLCALGEALGTTNFDTDWA